MRGRWPLWSPGRVMEKLKESILRMGSIVERTVSLASRSLFELNAPLARLVVEKQKEVHRIQVLTDDAVVRVLAFRHLMHAELRFTIAASRINAELGRIGEQGIRIAEATTRLCQYPEVEPSNGTLPRMAELAAGMVRDSVSAFVNSEQGLAREVLARDDALDGLRQQSFETLSSYMMSSSSRVLPAFALILAGMDLERIGHLAAKIAEDAMDAAEVHDPRQYAVH